MRPDKPHKNGLVTLAPKIIGSTSQDLVPGWPGLVLNLGQSRIASLRWKPGSIYQFNNIFNETEMIEFTEHVLDFEKAKTFLGLHGDQMNPFHQSWYKCLHGTAVLTS